MVLSQVGNLVEENKVGRFVMRSEPMQDAYREMMIGLSQLTVMQSVITAREETIMVIIIVKVKDENEPIEIELREMKKCTREGGMSGLRIVV